MARKLLRYPWAWAAGAFFGAGYLIPAMLVNPDNPAVTAQRAVTVALAVLVAMVMPLAGHLGFSPRRTSARRAALLGAAAGLGLGLAGAAGTALAILRPQLTQQQYTGIALVGAGLEVLCCTAAAALFALRGYRRQQHLYGHNPPPPASGG